MVASDATGRLRRLVAGTTAIVIVALVAPVYMVDIGLRPEIVLIAIGFAPLIVAAVVDLRCGRLPDLLVIPAAAVAVVAVVHPVVEVDAFEVVSGVVLAAGLLFALHVVSPASLGFGDVKTAVAAGGLVGIVDPLAVVVGLVIGTGLTAMVAIARRRRSLAFGPGLVIGHIVALGLIGGGG